MYEQTPSRPVLYPTQSVTAYMMGPKLGNQARNFSLTRAAKLQGPTSSNQLPMRAQPTQAQNQQSQIRYEHLTSLSCRSDINLEDPLNHIKDQAVRDNIERPRKRIVSNNLIKPSLYNGFHRRLRRDVT